MPTGSRDKNLKRVALVRFFCAAVALLALSSLGRAAEPLEIGLSAEEKAWIDTSPPIRVHNETNWPPFNFAIDGKPRGYSIDYMNLLAERAGLKIEYVTGPTWGEFLEMMKAGTLDVMLNIVKTPDRQKYLLYTSPIADNPNSILSRKQDAYDSLEQLNGKTVSIPKGFFYEEILTREFPLIKLHLVKGTLESMKAVAFGKADAALGELAVFNHLIENHLLTGLVLSGEVKMGDPELSLLNIATRKDLPMLASILRKAVASVTPEDKKAIETRWISAQSGFGIDTALVLQVGGVVGVVVLLIVFWNYRLRREVAESRRLEDAQQTLLQAVASPILVVRQDNGEVLYLNDAAAAGRPADKLIGTKAADLYVDPADREKFLEQMRTRRMVNGLEIPFKGPGGQVVWSLVSSRAIAFAGHEAYLTTWTDITARRNAEAELRESESKLKAILEYANVPVIIKDLDLRYILVNKAFVEKRGVRLQDAIGKTAYDFQPPEVAAEISKSDRYVIESGEPYESETKMINGAGEERSYFVIKYPVFSEDGAVVALGSMFTDITERKQNEALLQSFMDNANASMFVKDLKGRYVLANRAFSEHRGYEPEELIGKTSRELFPADMAEDYDSTDRHVVETGLPHETEARVVGADGVERHFFVTKFPVVAEDGTVLAIGAVGTDITDRKRAEQAQRENEALLKSFMDNSNAMMFVKDQDGRYLMSNKANADMRGFEPEEMIGKTVRELLGADDAAIYEETDRQVVETRKPVEREARVRGADGVVRDLFSSKFPVIAEDGRFIAIGSVLNDITELKQAQKALQEGNALTTAFLNNANAMMMVKEPKYGRCLLVNKTMADFAGRTPDEMIGKTVAEIYSEDAARRYEKMDELVKESGMPIERETPAVDSNGVVHDVLINKFPITVAGDEIIAIGSVVTNVTERNRIEAELKAAKEEAERVAEAKSDFIAVISHEVRTPMNGVLGMARLMLEQPLLAEQQSQIQTIVESSEALLTILNDLLDVSKLEAGKLELETVPFATRTLITDTANVMASRAKEKGLKLELNIAQGVPAALLGDANRLRQILLNLLSNAIKFTDRGRVIVAARGLETLSGTFKLVLSVTDTGIGIPRDEAGKLFSPYFQAAVDVNRERGGTGLGLSICRQLAELMGGEVTLESSLGEGSTFTLSVPLEITDDAPQRVAKETGQLGMAANGPRLRILMVEDNPINRKVAEGLLAKLGHKVFSAENGQEALNRIAEDDPYDIVLMDRHMPVMDGIEATKRIRAIDGPESTIPIIALTAAATPREIETCLESGMNDVVTKPIDPAQLTTALLRVARSDNDLFDTRSYQEDGDRTDNSYGPPVLDNTVLENLRDQIGRNEATELIEEFREVICKGAEAFRNDTEAGKLAGMTHHSHDMKSCAAVVGLMRFSQLCGEIEMACKADDIGSATRLGADIEDELTAALGALSNAVEADRGDAHIVHAPVIDKISHDLRNAMNTMFAYILLIQESAGDDLTAEQLIDYTGHIQSVGAQICDMTAAMAAALESDERDPKMLKDRIESS